MTARSGASRWISSEGLEFYIVAIASFLESAIDHYVDNLGLQFVADRGFVSWLQQTWLVEERRHGVRLRRYLADRWSDFEWDAAWAEYRASIPQHTTQHLNPSRALEMLSRCVTETEAAMMYRCIAEFAPDPDLQAMARDLSGDEAGHYRMFRRRFVAALRAERVGMMRAMATILRRTRLTIDRDVALAFAAMDRHWRHPPPFARMDYRTFLSEAGHAIAAHFPVRAAERMLFRPLDSVSRQARLLRPILRPILQRRVSGMLR
jgi:hypothetical protein